MLLAMLALTFLSASSYADSQIPTSGLRKESVSSPYLACAKAPLYRTVLDTPPGLEGSLPGNPAFDMGCKDDPNQLPITGVLIAPLRDPLFWDRWKELAIESGKVYEHVLSDSEGVLKEMKACLAKLHDWDHIPKDPNCDEYNQVFTQEILPSNQELRYNLALAADSTANAHLLRTQDLYSARLNPSLKSPANWPTLLPKEKLSKDELDEAKRRLVENANAIREDFINRQSEAIQQLMAHPSADPLTTEQRIRDLKNQIQALKNSQPADLSRFNDPEWQSYFPRELAGFQNNSKEIAKVLYDKYPLLALIQPAHPTPAAMIAALNKMSAVIRDEQYRTLTQVGDLEHYAGDMDKVFALTSMPSVTERVLEKEPSLCGAATGLLLHQANKETRDEILDTAATIGMFIPATSEISAAVAGAQAIRTIQESRKKLARDLAQSLITPVAEHAGHKLSVSSPLSAFSDSEDIQDAAVGGALIVLPTSVIAIRGARKIVRATSETANAVSTILKTQ